MNIVTSSAFERQYRKRAKGNLATIVQKQIRLFSRNHQDPRLHIKALHGSLLGLHEMRITRDYRIIFHDRGNNCYELIAFGTHDQLFRKH